ANSIIAARYDGGVVLGCDSLSSAGTRFVSNRFSNKITEVFPGILVARSGKSADAQFVIDVVEAKLGAYLTEYGSSPPVRTAATIAKNICYANKDMLAVGIVCAGWDATEGGSIFSVPQGGSFHELPFAVSGSGAPYALGYCDDHLYEGMSKEECIRHVQRAMELAVARDVASGGAIHLCVASAKGVERWTVPP
ncbi:unnamed protein product, partial [Choristocarpus tenellus]